MRKESASPVKRVTVELPAPHAGIDASIVTDAEKIGVLLHWVELLKQTAANHASEMDAIAAEAAAAEQALETGIEAAGQSDGSAADAMQEAKMRHAATEKKSEELLELATSLKARPPLPQDPLAQLRASEAWRVRKAAEEAGIVQALELSQRAMAEASERANGRVRALLAQTQTALQRERSTREADQHDKVAGARKATTGRGRPTGGERALRRLNRSRCSTGIAPYSNTSVTPLI